MRIRDPGWRRFGSGIRDGKKSDLGSATLENTYIEKCKILYSVSGSRKGSKMKIFFVCFKIWMFSTEASSFFSCMVVLRRFKLSLLWKTQILNFSFSRQKFLFADIKIWAWILITKFVCSKKYGLSWIQIRKLLFRSRPFFWILVMNVFSWRMCLTASCSKSWWLGRGTIPTTEPWSSTCCVISRQCCVSGLSLFSDSTFFRKLSFLTPDPILELSFPLENFKSYHLFKVFSSPTSTIFMCEPGSLWIQPIKRPECTTFIIIIELFIIIKLLTESFYAYRSFLLNWCY